MKKRRLFQFNLLGELIGDEVNYEVDENNLNNKNHLY